MGRAVTLSAAPQRIVSLVPSQTELLVDLNVNVVGRTRFCVHPAEHVNSIDVIGGTKKFNFDRIDQLRPDLIVGNKEENYPEGIERLAQTYPVWMSDIYTLDDALQMIRRLGAVIDRAAAADHLAAEIDKRFAELTGAQTPLRVAYLIWRDPWMVAGHNTFIDDMLSRCGLHNVFAERRDSRYPTVSDEDLRQAHIDALLLSSEPFPFHRRRYLHEITERFSHVAVEPVDGELFSWYGSRLLQTAPYLQQLQQRLRLASTKSTARS